MNRMAVVFRAPVLMALLVCSLGRAQDSTAYTKSVVDGTTPPGVAPGAPAGSYPLSGFDTVNLFNGRLNFALPLLRIGGRGEAGYTVTLKIDNTWPVESRVQCWDCNAVSDVSHMVVPGYNLAANREVYLGPGYMRSRRGSDIVNCRPGGTVEAHVLTRFTFTGGDGTEDEFRDAATGGKPFFNASHDNEANCNTTPPLQRGNVFVTADGSATTFVSDVALSDASTTAVVSDVGTENFGGGGVLAMPGGTMYHLAASGNVTTILDRNGNRVTLTYGLQSYPWKVTKAVDSLGREVEFGYGLVDSAGSYDQISFDGADAKQQRKIKIRYSTLQEALASTVTGCGASIDSRTFECLFPRNELNAQLLAAGRPINNQQVNPTVVSAVVLPDGREYSFKYNEYRELARVTLPSGGAIEYTHGRGSGASPSGVRLSPSPMIYRRVLERRVLPDGVNPEGKTVFEEGAGITVRQTGPDGTTALSVQRHYFDGFAPAIGAAPWEYSRWREGKELKIEEGKMVGDSFEPTRTTEHTWAQREPCPSWYPLRETDPRCSDPHVLASTLASAPAVDPRTTETRVIWNATGEWSSQVFAYDQFNNKTSVKDYNFSGALLRETVFNYESGSAYVNPPAGKATPPSAAHLRTRLKKQIVKDGAGTIISQTEYFNDNTAPAGKQAEELTAYSGMSGHDPAWSNAYLVRGNPSWIADWIAGSEWSYTGYKYDVAGNVVKIKHPTVNRNAPAEINPETTISYVDSYSGTYRPSTPTFAFPTSTTRTGQPVNHVTSAEYDYGVGKPTSYTDANGRITTFSYEGDLLDRLKKVTRPIGTVEFQYDPTANNNQVTTITSKGDGTNQSVRTTVQFDGLGREKRTVQVGGGTVDRAYDALGRLWRVSPPEAGDPTHWTETTFDELGRVVKVVRPDGVSQTLTHYNGRTTTSRDEAGRWMRTEVDGLGRLKSVTEDPTFSDLSILGTDYANTSSFTPAAVTTYTYDANGSLKTVTQGNRNRTFSYDGLNRLTSANNPESGIINYEYDLAGNMTKKTDPRFTTNLRYDAMSRLKAKTYTDSETPGVFHCYDGDTTNANGADCSGAPTNADPKAKNMMGALTMLRNAHATVKYGEFDALGRPLSSSQSVVGVTGSYDFTYLYNDIGLKQMTPPSGRKLNYDYDLAGRAYQVRTDGTSSVPFANVTRFAPHGGPEETALGDGTGALKQTISYNTLLQQTGMSVVKASAPSVSLLTLGYQYCANATCTAETGNNGNMVRQTIGHAAPGETALNLTWDFTYDKVNRLVDFKENNTVVESNGYDRYGNRWVTAGVVAGKGMPAAESWFSGSDNRMTNVAYDAAGNQQQFGSMTLTYDAENRIRAVSWSESATYFYDGAGRRVKKLTCGAPGPCQESTSGVGRTVYVYSADGALQSEYQAGATASGIEYYIADHLGTTRAIIGSNGEVQKRYDYRPFGWEIGAGVNQRSAKYPSVGYPGPGDGKTVKFTSKERDAETGLDYFGARYMSSAQGRFTSPDAPFADQSPLDPQSWNLYSYTRNNPLRYVDRTGQAIETPWDAFNVGLDVASLVSNVASGNLLC